MANEEPVVTYRLATVQDTSIKPMGLGSSGTWENHGSCPHCGSSQLLVVAQVLDAANTYVLGATRWLRCVACKHGSVLENQTMSPAVNPLREPMGLPSIDASVWSEVRACLGVGANIAAVMLCRKLLFHIAVAHGLPEKNAKDWAPSFVEALDHLESEGVITRSMRPWIDRIKNVGNEANHEVVPVAPEVALDVAVFTEQLLVLAYEMKARMAESDSADPEGV